MLAKFIPPVFICSTLILAAADGQSPQMTYRIGAVDTGATSNDGGSPAFWLGTATAAGKISLTSGRVAANELTPPEVVAVIDRYVGMEVDRTWAEPLARMVASDCTRATARSVSALAAVGAAYSAWHFGHVVYRLYLTHRQVIEPSMPDPPHWRAIEAFAALIPFNWSQGWGVA
jgi:hypothetical protein